VLVFHVSPFTVGGQVSLVIVVRVPSFIGPTDAPIEALTNVDTE
jgi:hypothetical protein